MVKLLMTVLTIQILPDCQYILLKKELITCKEKNLQEKNKLKKLN